MTRAASKKVCEVEASQITIVMKRYQFGTGTRSSNRLKTKAQAYFPFGYCIRPTPSISGSRAFRYEPT
jgi:hypothetical protein